MDDLIKIGLEDVANCFGIKEDLFQKYYKEEILKNEALIPLMEKRHANFDWTVETPLGGAGTTLNGVVLYSLIRHYSMWSVIETGVSGGYYSAFMLAAFNKNDKLGVLSSLELSTNEKEVGKLVPKEKLLNTKVCWNLHLGTNSLDKLAKWDHQSGLYCHDSLHTISHMLKELNEFKKSKSGEFFVFIDDEKSDNFWQKCLQTGAFKKPGYDVKYISGVESRLKGHLGGFIKYEKANV